MLIDLPQETVQIMIQKAQSQGVQIDEFLTQLLAQNYQETIKKNSLAERIHERFANIPNDNNECEFDEFLPIRNHYPKELVL